MQTTSSMQTLARTDTFRDSRRGSRRSRVRNLNLNEHTSTALPLFSPRLPSRYVANVCDSSGIFAPHPAYARSPGGLVRSFNTQSLPNIFCV